MELPNYTDYGKILEMNPFAAYQAGQQMDLANTFQQQKLAQEQERAKQMQLANIFSEQNNPQLIEKQRLSNLESTYGLPAKKVAGEIAEETAPQQKQLAMKKAILGLSEADISAMEQKGRVMAYDPDPRVREQGLAIMQLTPEFVKLKQQHANEMEKQQLVRKSAEEVARIHANATLGAAQTRQAGKGGGTLSEQLAGAKNYAHKANIYDAAAQKAEDNGDDVAAQQYRNLAEDSRKQDIAARSAAAQVAAGGQVSLEELAAGRLRRERDLREGATSPTQQTEPGQYQTGQTYKGKTGTYKFKGGNPADRNSWEKVQ